MTMASKKSDKNEKADLDELGYADAAQELETILDEIERGEADVDELSARVERAVSLIKHCREKLAGTELAVKRVVEQLEDDEDAEEEQGAR
jgi:exodeoxyribonuclease VII small subunit